MSEPITVRSITVRECRQRADFRGVYSTGASDPAENVWFIVSVSDGHASGFGECIPTGLYYEPGHIGRSSIDEWAEVLSLAESIVGQDARRLGQLVPEDPDRDDANSVKDTLDFALHDLVGRRLGVPVATLLGGIARTRVDAMPVLFTATPETMAERAADLFQRFGIRCFKLKPICDAEADVETLRRIREAVGPTARFYADANYALKMADVDEIVRYMDSLHALGLEVYEDPVDAPLEIYRALRKRTRVRIMIDEHARTPRDVMRIVQMEAADQINIHANWAGGFQPAIRKANIARIGGLPTMVGSVSYLGPGAAAYITLASVLGDVPCEQCFNDAVERGPLLGTAYELRDGKYTVPNKPGLGFDPDLAAIDAITARSETRT